jgi:LAO/AO transport system kinase
MKPSYYLRLATLPWNPPVLTCIAVEKTGILVIWHIIADHRKMLSNTGELLEKRR